MLVSTNCGHIWNENDIGLDSKFFWQYVHGSAIFNKTSYDVLSLIEYRVMCKIQDKCECKLSCVVLRIKVNQLLPALGYSHCQNEWAEVTRVQ